MPAPHGADGFVERIAIVLRALEEFVRIGGFTQSQTELGGGPVVVGILERARCGTVL
jgi:hypothetical protein